MPFVGLPALVLDIRRPADCAAAAGLRLTGSSHGPLRGGILARPLRGGRPLALEIYRRFPNHCTAMRDAFERIKAREA